MTARARQKTKRIVDAQTRAAWEIDAGEWATQNPAAAAKVLARALQTCTMTATSDWLLSLCKAEGFR